MESLGFSKFRELLDLWDVRKEAFETKSLIEDNELVFFFKKDNKIFGANENNRLTFAKIKNPDKKEKSWADEATFSALDLENKELNKLIFSKKDLDSIKVISQEEAEKELNKKGKKIQLPSDPDKIDEE